MELNASTRLIADAAWWDRMTPEQQKQYLENHPRSKRSKGAQKPQAPAPAPKSNLWTDQDFKDSNQKGADLVRKMQQEEEQAKKDKALQDYMKRRRARQLKEQQSA